MENKDIAAVESVQAVDNCMGIEVGNPTNVDIFYLFSAKPFSFHSFTSTSCRALEDTSTDTLLGNMNILAWHMHSKDPSIPSHKACRVVYTRILVHKRRMVVHIHIVDRPTPICESLDRIPCPSLCQSPILDLYPTLYRIQIPNQIQGLDSCIRERDSLHSIQLLFQSLVLSPKVLFYLPTAFYISPLFVSMHKFNYENTHRNI